jgi:hypothetical protein
MKTGAYEKGWQKEYLASFDTPIDNFISHYNAHHPDPKQQHTTIFYFLVE